MKIQIKIALASALVMLCALAGAANASAEFGFEAGSLDLESLEENGDAAVQAGSHPYSVGTEFQLNKMPSPRSFEKGLSLSSESSLRKVTVETPPGFIGNPTATPRCGVAEFINNNKTQLCNDSTQVGIAIVDMNYLGTFLHAPFPIYNLEPQPGQPALFGFKVVGVPVFAVPSIRTESDYGIDFNVIDIDRSLPITGNKFIFWGVPGSPVHDMERGERFLGTHCGGDATAKPPCPSGAPPKAFLTLPTDCAHGPFTLNGEVQAWGGQRSSESVTTHDNEGNPTGVKRCDRVPFEPTIDSKPTTDKTSSPSGLDFELKMPEGGLNNPEGLAQGALKRAVVTLPEGYTLNPSAGEGLGVCSAAQFASEQVGTEPGAGCPNASKLGSVKIDSPLLESGEVAEGSLYLAQPDNPATQETGAENPFDSLVAVYLVARVEERGVIIKSAGKVETDPATGQIKTTFDNLPQLPFTSFKLHFREGGRAPLASPSSCGEKTTVADLTPYSAPDETATVTSTSLITGGAGGPCPSGGLPPFKPGLIAGAINNAAGRYSPFNLRLFRSDEEQEITHFSIKLPPGVIGKLAGVPFCPDSGVGVAEDRERRGGGAEELESPSCPAASEIGHTLVGAGVGSILTYVPGKVYLAGPYHGSSLSIVAVTAGKVGPFDLGTVVVREALKVNPETAEVFVDATGSDPIPHIVDGIATHLRDIRVYVDRPKFVLNPTNCKATSTASTVLGSGLDFTSEADDRPFTATSPFQAADCASLGFEPKLALSLKGGTKRGENPAFKAVLKARPGDANIGASQVTLPHSEFLDQSHIKTVCTRVQFNSGQGNGANCPAGSVYGHAEAITPLLDEPLSGPVFLRSSSHNLPDLVAALHSGRIDVDLVGRIDSVGKEGRIRNSFEEVPDAPVTKFTLTMQGGAKGLLVNSTNLCARPNRALSHFTGQNGKVYDTKPVLKPKCGKHAKKHRAKKHKRGKG
jgi:hypothetical protein